MRARKSANFLVLGSATTENINAITQIGFDLRTKEKIINDRVHIIDINDVAIALHQKEVCALDEPWGDYESLREFSAPEFPYPQFTVEKMDMCNLAYPESFIDVVVSDYTINFLDDLEKVNQVFQEVSRVLDTGGIFVVIARSYNETGLVESHVEVREGLNIYKFQKQQYLDLAEKAGLRVVASGSEQDSDLVCVFQK